MANINRKLMRYVEENNISEVIKLLNNEADIHYNYDNPLMNSSYHGYYEMTELLLNYGANVNAVGVLNVTPLMMAFNNNNNIDVIELLLKNGADPKLGDTNSMITCCFDNNRVDILRLLCEYGLEFDKEYILGMSIKEKKINMIEYLLDAYPYIAHYKIYQIEPSDFRKYQFIKMLIERELIDIPD